MEEEQEQYQIYEDNGVVLLDSNEYQLKIDTNKNMYLMNKQNSEQFVKFSELNRDRVHPFEEKEIILINIYHALVEETQNGQ